jgi:hypothetical protein
MFEPERVVAGKGDLATQNIRPDGGGIATGQCLWPDGADLARTVSG